MTKYYQEHKEKYRIYGRRQYAKTKADPEKYARRMEQIYRSRAKRKAEMTSEEKEIRAIRTRKNAKALRARRRLDVLKAYGNRCACCGEDEQNFLGIDHIHGGGNAERRAIGCNENFYRRIQKLGYPKDKYRLLCHNCNMSRSFYGECPHRR
jgi:hypothetical protein